VELGVDAPKLPRPRLVTALDLDAADRQGGRSRPDRTEPAPPGFRLLEEIDVDLDVVDLHQAAHVRVPELLVHVREGTPALDAGTWVDDLVAVDLAAAAFDLVLRSERELARRGRRLLAYLHGRIVGATTHASQDLTSGVREAR